MGFFFWGVGKYNNFSGIMGQELGSGGGGNYVHAYKRKKEGAGGGDLSWDLF